MEEFKYIVDWEDWEALSMLMKVGYVFYGLVVYAQDCGVRICLGYVFVFAFNVTSFHLSSY